MYESVTFALERLAQYAMTGLQFNHMDGEFVLFHFE